MRKPLAISFALCLMPMMAHAGDNQFKGLEKGQSMVLIRLAEPHETRAQWRAEILAAPDTDQKYKRDPAQLEKLLDKVVCKDNLQDIELHGGSFNPQTMKSTRNGFTGRLDFTIVSDPDTDTCWLVGQVNVGPVALYAITAQLHWSVWYRKSTYFVVKPESYNFIGTIDRRMGLQRIMEGVKAGAMPVKTKNYEHVDGDLEGFVPNSDVPEGQKLAADFLSRAWGHPVQVDAPELKSVDVAR